jgi:hypothetical protein
MEEDIVTELHLAYITTHGTLHEMGNGRSLPSPGLYKFWATIDKYDHIVIKVEYIK